MTWDPRALCDARSSEAVGDDGVVALVVALVIFMIVTIGMTI